MDDQERKEKLESYGGAYDLLISELGRFPKEMWQFKDSHGCWSIHEHIVHLADSKVNSFIRCRRIIVEPGETLMAYDENRWAEVLNYKNRSVDAALELFKMVRQRSFDVVSALPAGVWSNEAYHPENGNMTLDDWLIEYERHVPEHVRFMQENVDEWSNI